MTATRFTNPTCSDLLEAKRQADAAYPLPEGVYGGGADIRFFLPTPPEKAKPTSAGEPAVDPASSITLEGIKTLPVAATILEDP